MTLQERLELNKGQDNGMDVILNGFAGFAGGTGIGEQVQQLPLTVLQSKENHTFKVRTTSAHYLSLLDSIRENGIKQPLLVRRSPVRPGYYEIIAGHTRFAAAQELQLPTVPCLVSVLSEEDADILMGESNIQRPDWLPSECAKTFKVYLEAVKRKSSIKAGGDRTKEQTATELPFARNRDFAAQRFGISGQMFAMYIKMNDLIPDLLELADQNKENPKEGIQIKAGYQLAFLSPIDQQVVLSVLSDHPNKVLKEPQAKAVRAASQEGHLTAIDVEELLGFRPSDSGTEKLKPIKLVLPDTYTERLSVHVNDPALLERICKAVDAYLEEMEEE